MQREELINELKTKTQLFLTLEEEIKKLNNMLAEMDKEIIARLKEEIRLIQDESVNRVLTFKPTKPEKKIPTVKKNVNPKTLDERVEQWKDSESDIGKFFMTLYNNREEGVSVQQLDEIFGEQKMKSLLRNSGYKSSQYGKMYIKKDDMIMMNPDY